MNAFIIKNGDVYAPKHLGINDILIAGNKIIEIGKDISLRGAKVIDAEGARVEPGLIDGHVHITGGGGEDGMLSRVPPLRERRIAEAGVTTLVGLLGTDGYTRSIKELVSKAKAIKEYGLSCYALTGSYQVPTITLTGSIGDDIIYIDEIVGVKIAISDHRCSLPSYDEILRILTEVRIASLMAKKAGLLHLHVGADKKGIEDLFRIARETPIPIKHLYPTHMGGHIDQAIDWLKIGGHVDITCSKNVIEAVSKVTEYGTENVTLSTDSNGSFPIWNEKKEIIGMGAGDIMNLRSTLEELISKGMKREDALSLATVNVAKAYKFNNKGEIKEGFDADIALFRGNDLRYLFANGNVMVEEGSAKKGMYEL